MAEPLWLLLDTDDTRRENKIYFWWLIAECSAFVDHSGLTSGDSRRDWIESRLAKSRRTVTGW